MSRQAALTPTSYVVLGMVALRGPSTSYDLKRAVGRSIGYFWPFPHAQLYSEPKRLVELGLMEVTHEEHGRRRQTYTVTETGLKEVTAWLAEPVTEPLQVRDIAEMKLFFGELATSADLFSLAREQVAQHQERVATYQAMQNRYGERADVASRMVPLALGLEMELAALNFWQNYLKQSVEKEPPSIDAEP